MTCCCAWRAAAALVLVLVALLIDATAGHTHSLLLDGTQRADIVASVRRYDTSEQIEPRSHHPVSDAALDDSNVDHVPPHHSQQHQRHSLHLQQRAQADAQWDNTKSDGPSFYFQFGGSLAEDDERAAGGGAVPVWTPAAITHARVRIALDAVRYRNNYESYITTRLCLHRVNLIRSRMVDNSLASFLFSVDGCELSKIAVSGRCDIYYCKLATYELKVTQKTPKKDIYIVQSIFKALTQKTMSELMQPSNLDIADDAGNAGNGGGGDGDDDAGGGDTKERAHADAASSSAAGAHHDSSKVTRALRMYTEAPSSDTLSAISGGSTSTRRRE